MLDDARRAAIGACIRAIPDFPKKGILFQDVTTLLLEPKVCMCVCVCVWGREEHAHVHG